MTVADATGDGHLDRLGSTVDGIAVVTAGHGDGTFDLPADFYVHPGQSWTDVFAMRMFVADINGDHQPDLIQVGAGEGMALFGACQR